MPIPTHVSHAEFKEALKPLCDLLGTSVYNFFSLTADRDGVTLVVPARHDEGPAGRVAAATILKGMDVPGHPHIPFRAPVVVTGSDGDVHSAEWAYEVVVSVGSPDDEDVA